MAPRRTAKSIDPPSDSESGSGSGSDAPEAVSLSTSKKQTQQRESERRQAEALRKQKDKARNRERDAKLKARAERNREVKGVKFVKDKGEKGAKKGKGKGKEAQSGEEEEDMDDEEETAALRARMERAMQDAQGESGEEDSNDEGDDEEDGPTFADFEGTSSGIEEGSEAHEEDSDEDEDEDDGPTFPEFDDASDAIEDGSQAGDSDEEDADREDTYSLPPAKSESVRALARSREMAAKKTPALAPKIKSRAAASASYLPDELFAAAFASQAESKTNSKRKSQDSETVNDKPAVKKKRRNTDKPRDVVVGSRAIRVLPNTHANPSTGAAPPPLPPATLPSRKVKKFLDRSLALKGGKQSAKAWERRPANIGVARRSYGPAYNFVRNP